MDKPWLRIGFVEAGKSYRVSTEELKIWRVSGEKIAPGGNRSGMFYLQARVAGGEPFKVGSAKIFTAAKSGLLELGMSHWDHRGAEASGSPRVTAEPWPPGGGAETKPATAPKTP